MSKRYENLVAGNMEGMDLKDARTKRDLFSELTGDLGGDAQANKRGVTALKNWEDSEGEPSEPSPAFGPPEMSLSKGVRDGTIDVADNAKELYSGITGKDFPGTGEKTESEILNEDIWEGFEAAGGQSGKEPKGMEAAILEGNNGRKEENPAEIGGLQTWGPARVIEGLLTKNDKTLAEGINQTIGLGMDPMEIAKKGLGENRFDDLTKGMEMGKEGLEILQKGPLKTLAEGLKTGLAPLEKAMGIGKEGLKDLGEGPIGDIAREGQDKMKDGLKGLVNILAPQKEKLGVKDLMGMVSKTIQVEKQLVGIVVGAALGDKKSLETLGNIGKALDGVTDAIMGKGPKKEETPNEPEDKQKGKEKAPEESFFDTVAGMVASQAAYKKGRKNGLPSKDAGAAAEVAQETTQEVGKSGEKGVKKAAELTMNAGKMAKDLAVKSATKAAMAVPPPLGQFLAIGIQVGSALADMAADAAKDKIGEEPDKGKEIATSGPNAAEIPKGEPGMPPPLPQMGMKNALKKGKGNLLKQLIPQGDLAEMATGATGSILGKGVEFAKKSDKDKTIEPPKGVVAGPEM